MVEDPTLEKIISAIKSLRNAKAPGEDNITAELLKGGGEELWKAMHQLIRALWNEEEMPEE